LETLEAFVEQLPSDLTFFVELRHPQWYADEKAFTGVTAMLEKKQTGTVITDASGRRDCLHMRLTLPQAFIRFVGNGLHPTDYQRCDAWINRMKQWKVAGIQNLYFFMHQHEELHSPELCRYLIPRVNDALGTRLHIPAFVTV
jgi:uncharacterized protein YecE (DUF72 family)